MKRYVLDSYALLAYCEGEEGAGSVAELFKKALDNAAEIFLCIVNWGEMYYIALREGGEDKAELYSTTIAKYPITIVHADRELTLQAARYKASCTISYADAFAAALAKLNKAELVTGDREFKQVEREIKIRWV
ncbi:MAG TPA: type II toxin-antitoxin system VapC family toxin [Thermodesulfobacteriota bacterium]|nr:type II toxin-antitoxin system VapC family toxin [Thermodesulfobacteriota bacterium]